MAKIDLYDPKWVDMVFAEKNQAYGAYVLRKQTSARNIRSIVFLLIAALLIGGFLAYKVHQQKMEEEKLAYMEAQELAKLRDQLKEKKEDKPVVQPKVEPKKEIPEVRETQKFTAPVIKKDELVKEENQVKQMDDLDKKVAVGVKDQEGVKDRTVEAIRNDIAVNTPPKEEVKQQVVEKIFDVVEVPPTFPGGEGQLRAWLASNTKYPPVAEDNGIQGRVIVQFVVERDGSVSNVNVVRGVDPSLDKEAARVVRSMPKWTPGKQNGQAVRARFNVPVVFKLQ
ncbi:MAG: energy transducer TonB [Prevotella sp.]|nr:energy transducer TonB [Prevotella sp.]MDY2634276.1 energy transducer TonB [Prevotella sp.]